MYQRTKSIKYINGNVGFWQQTYKPKQKKGIFCTFTWVYSVTIKEQNFIFLISQTLNLNDVSFSKEVL